MHAWFSPFTTAPARPGLFHFRHQESTSGLLAVGIARDDRLQSSARCLSVPGGWRSPPTRRGVASVADVANAATAATLATSATPAVDNAADSPDACAVATFTGAVFVHRNAQDGSGTHPHGHLRDVDDSWRPAQKCLRSLHPRRSSRRWSWCDLMCADWRSASCACRYAGRRRLLLKAAGWDCGVHGCIWTVLSRARTSAVHLPSSQRNRAIDTLVIFGRGLAETISSMRMNRSRLASWPGGLRPLPVRPGVTRCRAARSEPCPRPEQWLKQQPGNPTRDHAAVTRAKVAAAQFVRQGSTRAAS